MPVVSTTDEPVNIADAVGMSTNEHSCAAVQCPTPLWPGVLLLAGGCARPAARPGARRGVAGHGRDTGSIAGCGGVAAAAAPGQGGSCSAEHEEKSGRSGLAVGLSTCSRGMPSACSAGVRSRSWNLPDSSPNWR
ncbi:MAG: hypothetical protein R2705_22605 [Ilumatobacteraceae bacterium]